MKIITIDREYGAGGHSVGCAVAARLGLEIYDRDIIREAVRLSGIELDELETEEEKRSIGQAIIEAITPVSYEQKNEIFEAERAAILELAQKGACVMLGRCANAILAEEGIETLGVFLHAPLQARIPRATELTGITDSEEVIAKMKKIDAARKHYYEHYTSRKWADFRDYDLMFNMAEIDVETCIETICVAANK